MTDSSPDDELSDLLRASSHRFLPLVFLLAGILSIVIGAVALFPPEAPTTSKQLPSFPGERVLQQRFASSSSETHSTINLNSASIDEIDSLPGIGAVRAQQIIAHRPYRSREEFRAKSTLPNSVIEKILPYVTY